MSRRQFLNGYYVVSFALTLSTLALWIVSSALYTAPRARDGSGPDPVGLLIYFSTFIIGLFLLQSTLLALALHSRSPRSVFIGRFGLRIHIVLWCVFVAWILFVFGSG